MDVITAQRAAPLVAAAKKRNFRLTNAPATPDKDVAGVVLTGLIHAGYAHRCPRLGFDHTLNKHHRHRNTDAN